MENLGYYNGKFGPLEEMQVPMLDRVCFFGDGCYDATYSRNHVIYALDEHLDRFYNSAALLGIRLTQTKAEMGALLTEMVEKVDCGEQFVYCDPWHRDAQPRVSGSGQSTGQFVDCADPLFCTGYL